MYTSDFQHALNRYDFGRLVKGMVTSSPDDCGLELEVSQELANRTGKRTNGVIVPFEVMGRGLNVGTPTAGGNLVATNLLSNNFIEMLRPASLVASLGATVIPGLVGKVAIPRQTASASHYWLAENGEPTESQPAFDQVPMSPKTLGAYSDISRRMVLQSSIDIGAFVMADLRTSLGQELDRVILNGSGADNEPLGILNNTDVQLIELGTDGAALTWPDLVNLETIVASENADESRAAYVTTRQVRGKLQMTQEIAAPGANFIWKNAPQRELIGEGLIGGTRAVATTHMPSDLTKGTGTDLSSMIYGAWQDLVIGQWGGGIELLVDPYSMSTSGAMRIVAMTDVDFAVRHPESFVRVKDIVTV